MEILSNAHFTYVLRLRSFSYGSNIILPGLLKGEFSQDQGQMDSFPSYQLLTIRTFCFTSYLDYTCLPYFFSQKFLNIFFPYNTSWVLIYLIWKFVPFDCLHPIPPPPPPPISGNHKSDLFFYEFVCLFVCFWSTIDPQYYVSSWCTNHYAVCTP